MNLGVIETGGKQYLVREKDRIKIEKISGQAGDLVEFPLLLTAVGDKTEIGTPEIKRKAQGKIIRQIRAKKVSGVKYKPKTRQAKRIGHRQSLTEVEITKI